MSDDSGAVDDYLVAPYTQLISWQHRRPRFEAAVRALVAGPAQVGSLLLAFQNAFDLDSAAGNQLDIIGEWVGITRTLATALENIWFSWDEDGVGWDAGLWFQPFQPTHAPYNLDDEHYRILLKARVAANYWDGTIPGAYEAWDTLFLPEDYHILIQDGMAQAIPEFKFDGAFWEGWDNASWTLFTTPRSNYIRNSGLIGSKVGWVGNQAIIPTYWELFTDLYYNIDSIYAAPSGAASVDVLALGLSGTTGGPWSYLFFEATSPDYLLVNPGQVWTLSLYYQLLHHDAAITGSTLFIQAINASGAILHEYETSLDVAAIFFQRVSVTTEIPINVVALRVGIRFDHADEALVEKYTVLIGQPQLELGVSEPTAPMRTIGAGTVVHVPALMNIRVNSGMHMIYGLIAPYTAPPPAPDYFSFDQFTAELAAGAYTNDRAYGIPLYGLQDADIFGLDDTALDSEVPV